MVKFTTTVVVSLGTILTLALIIIIASSITRVNDDEVCQVLYPDDTRDSDNTVRVITEPGLYWVGPQHEKTCITRSTQHITFQHEVSEGLGRPISVQSSEGVPVSLEVDIEFRVLPDRFPETVLRTGFDSSNPRLLRTARAVIREVASEFNIQAFLVGTRQNISTQIQHDFSRQLTQDRVYVEVIKVNMLHIAVNGTYETLFQRVEDIRLQQIVASERPNLVRTEEARLNATQFIARQAQRNEQLQLARTNSTQALLAQSRRITEANTSFQQAMIIAESDRNVRLIRARTDLGRIVASRPRLISEVSRTALANATLAETNRRNMEVRARGNVSRALSNATRDITQASNDGRRQLEELVSREIDHTLDLFEIALEANISSQELRATGTASAAETLATTRAQSSDWLMLRDTLGLSNRDLASVLLFRAMKRADNMTVTLNNPAVPLRLVEGQIPDNIAPLAPLNQA